MCIGIEYSALEFKTHLKRIVIKYIKKILIYSKVPLNKRIFCGTKRNRSEEDILKDFGSQTGCCSSLCYQEAENGFMAIL
jgi:hypothetical protein